MMAFKNFISAVRGELARVKKLVDEEKRKEKQMYQKFFSQK